MDDFDLTHLFPQFAHLCTDMDKKRSVQYLCNLAFSDVINSTTNTKFPGTLVVSLSRKDMKQYFHGGQTQHLPYEKTHIYPWLQEVKRPIPILKHVSTKLNRKTDVTMILKKVNVPDLKYLDYEDHLEKRFLVDEEFTHNK